MTSTVINLVTLFTLFIGTCSGYDIPSILTEQQRIRIFGTNTSDNLPSIETVHIELLNIKDIKPFRKRPPTILQYRTTINDEVITLSLRPSNNFIAPGCLEHHYQKNNNKLLNACFKEDKHCFYTGRSLAHNDSWVAASVCGGLRGAIVYGNRSFIIAPLDKIKYSDPTHVHGTRHVIYRYQGDKEKCSMTSPNGHILYPQDVGEGRAVNMNDNIDVRRRYMEISVVLDPSLYNFHGSDTDQYTAIALNLASHLYANRRTGHDIQLVVKTVYKLESYEFVINCSYERFVEKIRRMIRLQKLSIEQTRDAGKLLDQYCEWKNNKNESALDADATIFLTKVDIAYNSDTRVTGLAKPSGMCKKTWNCALVEDSGPQMGYTVAHEIGHLLSMRHDGKNISIGETGCGSSIMNAYGASGAAASSWSNCSKQALDDFLKTQGASCLLNKPVGCSDHGPCNHKYEPELGVIYSADKQCQFMMGPNASLCAFNLFDKETLRNKSLNNSCEQLVCRENDGSMCILLTPPLLDGTDINNTRTWCIDGEPRAMTAEQNTPPINGAWSDWSTGWSTCSRSCGGGVKIRRRYCNKPKPQFGGRHCIGSDVKAVLCNVEKCHKTFKETQCADYYNYRSYKGYDNITFSFVPYLQSKGDESCKLQCKGYSPDFDGAIFMNETLRNYNDGTECIVDKNVPFTRCIDGRCRSFGCDGHLDSGLVFDKCGQCNGTGKGCVTTRGKFTKHGNASEFETFLVIPSGSAGIVVNQTNQYCFLSAVIEGTRVFNPHGYAVASVFQSHGIRIHYNNNPEQIRIPGPITADISLQVYRKYDYREYASVTPNISYEYNTITTQGPRSYFWSATATQCSKSCGSGITTPIVQCRDFRGIVADYHCKIDEKLNEIPKPCNTHYCPPRWFTGDWGSCSVTCEKGARTRYVECVQEKDGNFERTNDSLCSQADKPATSESCDFGKCPSVWRTSGWSQCSTTCGVGQQTRVVQCYDYRNTSRRVHDLFCSIDDKPADTQLCNLATCWNDTAENCTDMDDRCDSMNLCVGQYKGWAQKNCLRMCEMCSVQKEDCRDEFDNCPRYGHDVCKNYTGWAKKNCVKFCGYCGCPDKFPGCSKYGQDICTGDYKSWAIGTCARFCGYCNCKDLDKDCSKYGEGACTNPEYIDYMKKNCARFCLFC